MGSENRLNGRGTLMSWLWRKTHGKNLTPPYYCYYSLSVIILKPIRKWLSAVLIPTIPFSNLRVQCYRWCGYKIGKNCFIGMRCYLDDMCHDLIEIEDNVTISYGVYFACHGRKQGHNRILIKQGAYIGMNASIIARREEGTVVGRNAIVGACSLVNKSVPDEGVVAGIPARAIGKSGK